MWGQEGAFGADFLKAASTDSNAIQEKGDKSRRTQNVMPVTVKQLLNCQEESFELEGFVAHLVTIVGITKAVDVTPAKMSLYIDDQTGTIECVSYIGTDEEDHSHVTMLSKGSYARVIGAFRSMKGIKYLLIYKCHALTDLNELTCHLLEVIRTGQKMKQIGSAKASEQVTDTLGSTFRSSMIKPSENDACGGGIPGFSRNQNLIHRILASCKNESGMHKDQVYAAAKSTMTLKEVLEGLDFLSNEGHVFSTIDDDHYKATDSNFF